MPTDRSSAQDRWILPRRAEHGTSRRSISSLRHLEALRELYERELPHDAAEEPTW